MKNKLNKKQTKRITPHKSNKKWNKKKCTSKSKRNNHFNKQRTNKLSKIKENNLKLISILYPNFKKKSNSLAYKTKHKSNVCSDNKKCNLQLQYMSPYNLLASLVNANLHESYSNPI